MSDWLRPTLVTLGLVVMLAGCGGDPGSSESGGDGGEQAGPQTVEVVGVDYAFEGVPESLPAGPTTFTFVNDSKDEPHEMVLFRIKPNVEESLQELLRLPEQQARKMVTPVGGTGAPPGRPVKQDVTGDLAPGNYGMLCFVPVDGNGPPHFTRGMVAEFTVEG